VGRYRVVAGRIRDILEAMRLLRSLGLGLSLFGAAMAVHAPAAEASVSVAVYFEALVDRADTVAVVSPVDQSSVWEGGRIVTYTKLKVERPVAGPAASEVWVRTLGGSVGNIGQSVSGEPQFTDGQSSILFLRKVEGAFMVVERGQGQYPLVKDAKTSRVLTARASDVGMLMAPRPQAAVTGTVGPTPKVLAPTRYAGTLAQDVLINRGVDDVVRDIAEAWNKRHATK
jgi:hypothetical protein